MTSQRELDDSVRLLRQSLAGDAHDKHSPLQASQFFLSSLHLLCELKQNQHGIRLSASNGDQALRFPLLSEIRAIHTVVHEADLFRGLVRCLHATTQSSDPPSVTLSESSSAASFVNGQSTAGRKRSNSTVEKFPNKSLKTLHSPVPTTRITNLQDISRNHASGIRKPTFNVPVLAASVLFAAFEHLDHWPVQFLRAYAEDCFGPRLWVDHQLCSLFVANLALAHSTKVDDEVDVDIEARSRDAAALAETYRDLDIFAPISIDSSSLSPIQSHGSGDVLDIADEDLRRSTLSLGSRGSAGRHDDSDPKRQRMDDVRSSLKSVDDSVLSNRSFDDEPDNSSSSGEDDVIDERRHKRGRRSGDEARNSNGLSAEDNAHDLDLTVNEVSNGHDKIRLLYPLEQKRFSIRRVRRRYFATNLRAGHEAIAMSLADRLRTKSKQNSSLLQCLPSFTNIPGVRRIVASNLEKWLQSPALAGLARVLFTSTVSQMESVDPPLKDDLQAIDSLIQMHLKANQLNAHIDNITSIAIRMPFASVANQMYANLLRELVAQSAGQVGPTTDQIKMIGAIHRAVSPQISYEAMAAALLTLLVSPPNFADGGQGSSRLDRYRLVRSLREILRAIASYLGSLNGCLLVESLLSLDVSSKSWSIDDEEDKARLMFQCIALSVSQYEARSGLSDSLVQAMKESLNHAKKLILTWSCTEYGPYFRSKGPLGLSSNYFNTALVPSTRQDMPRWLNTVRCLLFIEDNDDSMKSFMNPGKLSAQDDAFWEQELPRVRLCREHGGDLYDGLFWIVLKSTTLSHGIDAEMGILLLENLFQQCTRLRQGLISVRDPHLVWELYNLVQYTPTEGPDTTDDSSEVPRLAHSGLWWRVTILALVMCSRSPEKIGVVLWQEHPTLRALIKMVTSNRFRFPTVDCDEDQRSEMKSAEQAAREKETKAAELLFLPRQEEDKKAKPKASRMSRRLLLKQQEADAAKEIEETRRRKALLREAQKSIILWDPDGPARKPPREAVDMLLALEDLFGLSCVFQHSSQPDFVLMTVGQTTRGAIERAYDWLIPIVSTIPETIARLPSSASCFLLLRAYGTEGDERKQLKELSAPLLQHVQDSLQGKHGEADAVKAFDLLMTDVASKKPDRRRCARRVLNDSLAQFRPATAAQSWMMTILLLDNAKALVKDSVQYMSTAAGFERGGVLRALVLALEQHVAFAEQHGVQVQLNFVQFLIRLICSRPSVCAEAIDASPSLRSLVVRVLLAEFSRHAAEPERQDTEIDRDKFVLLETYGGSIGKGKIRVPLDLLQSLSVLLSIWRDENAAADAVARDSIKSLIDALLHPENCDRGDDDRGLASAVTLETGESAVPVDLWIMLTKSRSDTVARRAALSSPESVLPRLLLCSGLPRASLLTMIDRLGRLGDASEDKGLVYENLLKPLDGSKLDLGQGIDLSLALLGRLSAYSRLHSVVSNGGGSSISTTFLTWLRNDCKSHEDASPTRSKSKRSKAVVSASLLSLSSVSSVMGSIPSNIVPTGNTLKTYASRTSDMDEFKQGISQSRPATEINATEDETKSFISSCFADNKTFLLDSWFEELVSKPSTAAFAHGLDANVVVDLAIHMIVTFRSMDRPHGDVSKLMMKWIPVLARTDGKSELWDSLFRVNADSESGITMDTLVSTCLLSWSMLHVSQCRDWIIMVGQGSDLDYDFQRIALFLVSISEQVSAQTDLFSEGYGPHPNGWANSREFVVSAATIGIRGISQMQATAERSLRRRNSPPPSLALFLLVGRCGKKQLRSLCDATLEALSATELDDLIRKRLELVLLRLYLCYPTWMDLGSANIRTILTNCAERLARKWGNWRAGFDDKIEDSLIAMAAGELRAASSLTELCRKHPLLILRKLPNMSKLLMSDATMGTTEDRRKRRDVVVGRNLSGSLDAKYPDHSRVTLAVCHWGYEYTETLWIALLDVLSAMPPQVVFTCGSKVGLFEMLGLYIELSTAQLDVLVANKTSRLKDKLTDVFSKFRQFGPKEWEEWLQSTIDGVEVRHVLVTCSLVSTEEAIDTRKKE